MGAVEALTICFSGDMLLCETKERFLMNSANKQHFIKHLIATFRENGFESVQAPGDADSLIVKTALEKATETQTAVVYSFLFSSMSASSIGMCFSRPVRRKAAPRCGTSKLYKMLLEPVCAKTYFLHMQ